MVQRAANWIGRVRKSEYARNVLIVGSGGLFAYAVSIFTSPIISRIFTREAYGAAGYYGTGITILSVVVTLMLPTAVVIVKEGRDLYRLISAIKWLLGMSAVALIPIVAFGKPLIQNLLGDTSDGLWLYFLPPGLWVGGMLGLTNSLNVRAKEFSVNTRGRVSSTLVNKGSNIGLGLATGGYYLVFIINSFLKAIPVLWVQNWSKVEQVFRIPSSFGNVRLMLRKYWDYPAYMLPGNFLSKLSMKAPFLLFSGLYGLEIAGSYLFASAMLSIPIQLVGGAVRPVFLQRANALFQKGNKEALKRLTAGTNYALYFSGLLPFALLTVFGQEIFAWVFSAEWRQAGLMAQYLSIYYLFMLASSPLSALYRISNREKDSFITQIVLFLSRVVPLIIGLTYFDVPTALLFLTVGNMVGYFFHFYQMTNIANSGFWKPLIIELSIFMVFTFLCLLWKQWIGE